MIPVVPQNLFRGADGSETNDPGDSVGRRNRWKNSNGGIGRHAQAECWRCVFFSTVSAHKKRVARFLQHLLGQMPLSVARPRRARTGNEVLRHQAPTPSSSSIKPDAIPRASSWSRPTSVRLASQYGRYGYRRITARLRVESWLVNH